MRGTRAWPPTGLIPWFSKTEGNTYATLLHHHFLFKGKPTQCSRGSKKDFWRCCGGGLRSSQDIPSTHHNSYPSHYIICHLPLVFLSPTSPLPFYSPSLSQSPSLFPFAFLFACVLDYLLPWRKIIPNCVTFPIPIIMISLALRLLLLMMLNLVKSMLLC